MTYLITLCIVTLHVSGASAHHQKYLKIVRRPLVHVLSLQVSHHISLLGPEPCRNKTCTVLHQVGVSFDLVQNFVVFFSVVNKDLEEIRSETRL